MKRNHSTFGCAGFHASRPTRRAVLRVGGMGLLGLTMPRFLKAAAEQAWTTGALKRIAPRAKSIVFLYQFGGPSHIDMFDMKPDAPQAIRSPHKPIPSNVPGIHVSEHLPRVAKIVTYHPSARPSTGSGGSLPV